ncbi:MAG: hypothetical protein HOD58_03305 [Gammaproteobacteria bacterium]|jgi:hypothetical protein|nr:hypothetical protein [Gammaproteobacteria bacterium]MBT4328938.1 hypothetical protein [Gammaproteobacteria bacterium]MBT5635870.1 hypothetical protein [Gammaproteobacteria bacterium]
MKNLGNQSIRLKILLPFTLILLSIIVLFIGFGYSQFKATGEDAQRNMVQMVSMMFKQYVKGDTDRMELAIGSLLSNSKVSDAFRSRSIDRLHQITSETLSMLREQHRIGELYLVTPQRKVILRTHQSSRAGDQLNHQTLIKAQESGAPAHGLELAAHGALMLSPHIS